MEVDNLKGKKDNGLGSPGIAEYSETPKTEEIQDGAGLGWVQEEGFEEGEGKKGRKLGEQGGGCTFT